MENQVLCETDLTTFDNHDSVVVLELMTDDFEWDGAPRRIEPKA